MRMTRWQRVALVLFGIALLSAGVVGSALKWPDVALTAFIAAGVLVLLGAVAGAMPKGGIKDGFEWPEVDTHPRIEQLEAEIAELRADAASARGQAKDAANLVIDYILAQQPDPNDGMTDKERLEELETGLAELESEISGRYFTGETYDDGYDVTEMEEWRNQRRKELAREERRQAARTRFRGSSGFRVRGLRSAVVTGCGS